MLTCLFHLAHRINVVIWVEVLEIHKSFEPEQKRDGKTIKVFFLRKIDCVVCESLICFTKVGYIRAIHL